MANKLELLDTCKASSVLYFEGLVEILGYRIFGQIFSEIREIIIEKCRAYKRIPVVP